MSPSPDPSHLPQKPAGAYRVIHSADWHLGKMLGDHSREQEHRRFLDFLLHTIKSQSVDALIVAGDIFDSANPPQNAVALYYDFLSELYKSATCAVVIIAGNHDSPAHLAAPARVLKTLRTHVSGSLTGCPGDLLFALPSPENPQLVVAAVPFLRDRDLRLGISGQSAAEIQKDLTDGITSRYAEVAEAAEPWRARNIPLLACGHLTVVGSSVSDSEREIHVGGLGAVNAEIFPTQFAYVALGHLHRPQAAGHQQTIRYSGSPIPLSFSEANDVKELRILDFADGKLCQQAPLPIPTSRILTQIRTRRETLAADLAAFQPPPGELRAWLEVVIEDPLHGENLHATVHELAAGREFDVIRVASKSKTQLQGLSISDPAATNNIERLLNDPALIFTRRLDAEPTLSDPERLALQTAFQELLNLHAEQHREQLPANSASTTLP